MSNPKRTRKEIREVIENLKNKKKYKTIKWVLKQLQ